MIFGIIGNTYNKEVPSAVYSFLVELNKYKVKYVIDEKLLSLIRKKYKIEVPSASRKNINNVITSSDFIISFGGDGTFLSAAKLVGNKGKPIIGVNLGKLGFLSDTSTDEIRDFILKIRNKKYKLDERTVLEASFIWTKKKLFGLNEIVIGKVGLVKTIEIDAYYNGKFVIKYHADGLIVSTPTGSTAYSMSAGGPIINPESKVFILSPICAHTLTARPIVLPDEGKIRIEVNSRIPIVVTADGNDKVNLKSKAIIKLRKANYKIKLAKSPDSNYFDVLNKKLLLGQDIRK